MIASFKRWFVRKQNDIIFCLLTYQSSNSFVFKRSNQLFIITLVVVVVENFIARSIWRADRNQSSATNIQLKMRISIKSFIFFTTLNRNDWFLIQIFKTFRIFVEIRIVIAQWRRIWMSIHIWISVWFEQFQFNDFICFFNNRKFVQLFWEFQLAFFFLVLFIITLFQISIRHIIFI